MRSNAGGNMKRLILLAITFAAAAQAQQPAPCLKLSQVKVDNRALHQDNTTRVKLKFEAKHCNVLIESPTLGRQEPILEMQDEPGLSPHIGQGNAFLLDQSTVTASIIKAQEISTIVTVSASSNARLGQHKLPWTIRYKVMDRQGNVSDEVLSFDVPIKVKPARVFSTSPGFLERHPVFTYSVVLPLAVIGMIALLPVLIVWEMMGLDTV
jgi:hypothetical protein